MRGHGLIYCIIKTSRELELIYKEKPSFSSCLLVSANHVKLCEDLGGELPGKWKSCRFGLLMRDRSFH